MIRAVIFDLDGTLVQTEILKARSYAQAAVTLAPGQVREEDVLKAFAEVVGRSRQEVAEYLLDKFHLAEKAAQYMEQFGVMTPWQAFVQLRLQIYQQMLREPDLLKRHLCPYNVGLLQYVRERGYPVGLATMSHCQQARYVLTKLELLQWFDFVATRDDVENGKPDPEIYLLVARMLKARPDECLVIEDSLAGVKAALSAGMACIAVTSDYTRRSVHDSGLLDDQWIVDDPHQLLEVARKMLKQGAKGLM